MIIVLLFFFLKSTYLHYLNRIKSHGIIHNYQPTPVNLTKNEKHLLTSELHYSRIYYQFKLLFIKFGLFTVIVISNGYKPLNYPSFAYFQVLSLWCIVFLRIFILCLFEEMIHACDIIIILQKFVNLFERELNNTSSRTRIIIIFFTPIKQIREWKITWL